jgi:hypothetical protein
MPVTRSMFEDDWRVRCPEGHVRLRPYDECRSAYCQGCRRSYAFDELVDGRVEA